MSRSGTYAFIHDNEVFISVDLPSLIFFQTVTLLTLELIQESDIIFIQQSHIVDLIFQQSDTLKTDTECKSRILFRINAAHFQYMRMNHSAAKDLDPAGTFTEAASFSSALEAAHIYLCAGLCEREMMGTELCLRLRSEQLLCKYFQSSFQVSEGNVLVDHKTFDLVEGR